MFGELFDEILGGHVLDSDSHLLVDNSVGDLNTCLGPSKQSVSIHLDKTPRVPSLAIWGVEADSRKARHSGSGELIHGNLIWVSESVLTSILLVSFLIDDN